MPPTIKYSASQINRHNRIRTSIVNITTKSTVPSVHWARVHVCTLIAQACAHRHRHHSRRRSRRWTRSSLGHACTRAEEFVCVCASVRVRRRRASLCNTRPANMFGILTYAQRRAAPPRSRGAFAQISARSTDYSDFNRARAHAGERARRERARSCAGA